MSSPTAFATDSSARASAYDGARGGTWVPVIALAPQGEVGERAGGESHRRERVEVEEGGADALPAQLATRRGVEVLGAEHCGEEQRADEPAEPPPGEDAGSRHRERRGQVEQARPQERAVDAEARRDRVEPLAAIELHVLKRIEHVEASHPRPD